MLITPHPGAHPDNILQTLHQTYMDAGNASSAGPQTAYQRLLAYLEWATNAARRLRNQISSGDIDRLVLTRRYHALLGACGTLAGSDQQRLVNGLVSQELAEREADLDEAMKAFTEHTQRWQRGCLVIADSSFYL